MLEVFIERWCTPDGTVDYRWSVWRDGRRVEMGREAQSSAAASEREARAYCRDALRCEPDRITRL